MLSSAAAVPAITSPSSLELLTLEHSPQHRQRGEAKHSTCLMASAVVAGGESSGRYNKKHRHDSGYHLLHHEGGTNVPLQARGCSMPRISDDVGADPQSSSASSGSIREAIRETLDDPESSLAAQIAHYLLVVLIGTSTLCVVLETVQEVAEPNRHLFRLLEKVFTAFFTLEILLRLWAAESCRTYFSSLSNLVDVLATSPWYVEAALALASPTGADSGKVHGLANSFKTLRMVRLLRILRMAKAARHSEAISTVLEALGESLQGLFVLVALMGMGSILAATAAYTVESEVEGTQFKSVPAASWWAITTMTTVGYGDLVPATAVGKCIGALTMLVGILVVSISVAIITTSFTESYQRRVHLLKIAKHAKRLGHAHSGSISGFEDERSRGMLCVPMQEAEGSTLGQSLTSLGEDTIGLLTQLETLVDSLHNEGKLDDSGYETEMCDFLLEQCRLFFKTAAGFADTMSSRCLEVAADRKGVKVAPQ